MPWTGSEELDNTFFSREKGKRFLKTSNSRSYFSWTIRYMPARAARTAITFRIARISADTPDEVRKSKSTNRRNVTAKRYP
jgi:hypothetical protein